jgi:hypothetical protein
MGEWQPIETAPKNRPVLLWEKEAKCATVGVWNDRYTEPWHALVHGDAAPWNDLDRAPTFEATHWMPLPDPPQGGAMSEQEAHQVGDASSLAYRDARRRIDALVVRIGQIYEGDSRHQAIVAGAQLVADEAKIVLAHVVKSLLASGTIRRFPPGDDRAVESAD